MKPALFSSFDGGRRVASGDLTATLAATKAYQDSTGRTALIFDNGTGRQTDFDFRGTLSEVLERSLGPEPASAPAKAGPGRPRLGVVCAEVSLLPRHWEWLNAQPAKASATIRRLVDGVRHKEVDQTGAQIDAVAAFMWAICGNFADFEEASRALYARNWPRFRRLVRGWPEDIQHHIVEQLCPVLPLLPAHEEAAIPPWAEDSLTLAAQVARGDTSASAVIDCFLKRIEEINPRLKALTAVWSEEARQAARLVDERLDRGEAVGPLAGVPFVAKANMDVAGHPSDQGIPALAAARAPHDAPLVARLRAAGAIPIAHSNLPDLSLRFETTSTLHGHTVNPRDPALSPGGSSGGSGVALGSGMASLALGNDAGGSLRLPALFAGCAALKPSSGRFAADHRWGGQDPGLASQVIPVDGVLARSVADLALVFRIASGAELRDPRALPLPLEGEPVDKPLRLAVCADPLGLGLHPAVRDALDRAAAALEAGGYRPERVELPCFAEILHAYDRFILTEFSLVRSALERLLGEDSQRYLALASQDLELLDLAGYVALTGQRLGWQRRWQEFFATWPVLVGPVFNELAVPVDADIASLESHRRISRSRALCSVSSFLGLPSVSVPTGLSGGLPTGVQIIAGAYREDLCLEAAQVVETALGRIAPVDPGRMRYD